MTGLLKGEGKAPPTDASTKAAGDCPRARWLQQPWFWFTVALAARLAYFLEQQHGSVLFHQPSLDEAEMVHAAKSILRGDGFGPEPLFKAPLYPLLLALVMGFSGEAWLWVIRLVQHACGATAAVMAFDSARRIAPEGRGRLLAGPIAAAAIAFYGPLVRLEGQILLDFFTFFFQSALVWVLVRFATNEPSRRQLAIISVAGVLAMLSVLNRPTILPVLPFLGGWLVWIVYRAGRPLPRIGWHWALLSVFAAPVLAGLLAMYLRNAWVGGEGLWMPWQGGFSFYHANRAGANGRYYVQTGYSMNQTGNPTRELILEGYAAARGTTAAASARPLTFREVDRFWYDRAWNEIRTDPGRWLGLMISKGVGLFTTQEVFNIENYDLHKRLSWILTCLPVRFGMLWPVALASLAWWGRWPDPTRRLLALLYLYVAMLGGAIALYYISGRFRMPLVFPVAVCFAVSLSALRETGTRGMGRWGWLLLAGVGAVWSWGDWWGIRSEALHHQDWARLSTAAFRDQKPALALEYADQVARVKPEYPPVAGLRGQALVQLQRYDEAATCFVRAAELEARDPIPPLNLGLIFYYHLNKPNEAARWFAEARRRRPSLSRAAGMLVLTQIQTGKLAEAQAGLREFESLEKLEAGSRQIWLLAGMAYACKAQQESLFQKYWTSWKQSFGEQTISQAAEDLERLGVSAQCEAYRRNTPPPSGPARATSSSSP